MKLYIINGCSLRRKTTIKHPCNKDGYGYFTSIKSGSSVLTQPLQELRDKNISLQWNLVLQFQSNLYRS